MKSLTPTLHDAALLTDLYQLTMAAVYFERKINPVSTFELFVRRLPQDWTYFIAAGLEQAMEYLRNLRFQKDHVDYLRRLPVFKKVSDAFFQHLLDLRFTGSVNALPEGTVCFPNEPILQVTAPLIEAQIIETYLLCLVNFETLIASKAARICRAAQGRPVVEFGARRAHGPQAALLATRASYIGGCIGTSNVLAGHWLGIPVYGTMAHSFVMTFDRELDAFAAYSDVFPQSVLLVDTYDTVEGVKNAVALKRAIAGVRLDSGDLAVLAKEARKILTAGGLSAAKIVASGDLNEYKIARLLADEAPIDLFGVGTELVVSRDTPSLGGVYKLVEQDIGGRRVGRLKLSRDKATVPYKKQVFRLEQNEVYTGDTIAIDGESLPGTPLLLPPKDESITDMQKRARQQLSRLPKDSVVPVRLSKRLEAELEQIAGGFRRRG